LFPRIVIIGGFRNCIAKKIKKIKSTSSAFRQTQLPYFSAFIISSSHSGLEAGSIAYPIRKVIQEYDVLFQAY
jgi:NADH dehydrogenase